MAAIAQFSSSTGTLAYIPDPNYGGKDGFTTKVHDGTVFSKDAKVSIKIEKNEKLRSRNKKARDFGTRIENCCSHRR